MNSYSESTLPPRDQILLILVERVVKAIPTTPQDLRCHEVARIVEMVVAALTILMEPKYYVKPVLYVQDGRYGWCDHSWLWTSKPKHVVGMIHVPNIIDPYCVGRLPMVQLLDCSCTALPHYGAMYQPTPTPRTDIDQRLVMELSAKVVEGANTTGICDVVSLLVEHDRDLKAVCDS